MKEEVKQALSDEYAEIKKEVEGKSEEELREMERAAKEEIYVKQVDEASEYIYNIMELGETYSEDHFIDILDKIREKNSTPEGNLLFNEETYTEFPEDIVDLTIMVTNLGYSNFGKNFINNIVEKDKESAKRVLEVVIQKYVELQSDIAFIRNNAEIMMNEKMKEEEKEKDDKSN